MYKSVLTIELVIFENIMTRSFIESLKQGKTFSRIICVWCGENSYVRQTVLSQTIHVRVIYVGQPKTERTSSLLVPLVHWLSYS